jgi:hypothetical protein
VPLPASTTVGLGGVAPRSIDDGRMQRCARTVEASSSAMVVSSIGSTKFMRILIMNIAQRFDGGDDTCSMYMSFSLNVC